MTQEKYHLVTGASGLVGKELVYQLLQQGKKVKALYNNNIIKDLSHENLILVKCDLLDVFQIEAVMEDVEYVYHCAGLVSYIPKQRKKLYQINVDATANVVNAAIEQKIKKMVHVSSVATLGKNSLSPIITEENNWEEEISGSVYSRSKYWGELEVWRGIAEGLNAVIVNPSIILGPGNWDEGSTAIFKNVYNEFKWYSEGISGFVDVRDVAKAITMLMDADITAEKFIISAENETYKNIFFKIADAFNKKRPERKVTKSLAAIVWRIEKLKSLISKKNPLITKETAASAFAEVKYDNSKLLLYLPDFNYHRIEDTVNHTCKILQQKVNS